LIFFLSLASLDWANRIVDERSRCFKSSQIRLPVDARMISLSGRQCPKSGKINSCRAPYQNDLVTFDASETIRGELKHRSDHLVSDMQRAHDEWTRLPKDC
jgi:hypothetical protein